MGTPTFKKIQHYITDRIDNRTYKPGDKIPTEKQLSEQFGVSRMTVNRAIVELSKQGVVERTAGKGTYVAGKANTTFTLSHPIDFAHQVEQRGNEHRIEVLRHEMLTMYDNEVATLLGIADGTTVGFSLILNYENELPVLMEKCWVNKRLVPAFMQQDFSTLSPSLYLYNNFQSITIENVTEAVNADSQIQQILNINGDTPCLRVRRRMWSNDQLISFTELIGNGYLYRIVSEQ